METNLRIEILNNNLFACFFVLVILLTGCKDEKTDDSYSSDVMLADAYDNGWSNLQVLGDGWVYKILEDDTMGSRHQRFLLKLASGQTLLVAHNIDLAAKIDTLQVDDWIQFYGVYEWNKYGGVIHWTHDDPSGRHENGWLRHNGLTYR